MFKASDYYSLCNPFPLPPPMPSQEMWPLSPLHFQYTMFSSQITYFLYPIVIMCLNWLLHSIEFLRGGSALCVLCPMTSQRKNCLGVRGLDSKEQWPRDPLLIRIGSGWEKLTGYCYGVEAHVDIFIWLVFQKLPFLLKLPSHWELCHPSFTVHISHC